MVRRYGHIPGEQTSAVEMQALSENVVFGSPGEFSIDSDPPWGANAYPYGLVTESDPESSGEDNASNDGNNDSNKNDKK